MIMAYYNNVLVINSKKIVFEKDIKCIIEFEDKVIIQIWNLATGNIKQQPYNNIYAYNANTDYLWNIKEIVKVDGIYTQIRLDENNMLIVNEFIGRRYIIDINNRQVIDDKAYK